MKKKQWDKIGEEMPYHVTALISSGVPSGEHIRVVSERSIAGRI